MRRTGEVALLFSETQSRIIVTVQERDLQPLLKAARLKKVPAKKLGTVTGKSLKINELVDIPVGEIEAIWSGAFEKEVLKSCVA